MTETPRKTLTLKRPVVQNPTESTSSETSSRANRLLSKRIIRREELPVSPAAKSPSPKNERADTRKKTAAKPRNNKPKTEVNAEPPPSKVLAHQLNDKLFTDYPIWANYQPLALGVEEDILAIMAQEFPPASKRVVQRLLRMHCRHGKYLQAVLDGSQRYTLAGEVAGEISDEERRYAVRTLEAQAPHNNTNTEE